MEITNESGKKVLERLEDKSIDLILTDPPYVISKKSGMNTFISKIEEKGLDKDNMKMMKTEVEWEKYKKDNNIKDGIEKKKKNYMKYGNVTGKKYGYKTDFGEWDKKFTMEELEEYMKLYYKKLKIGGTCIIFFDVWKITEIKKMMERSKFKQIRLIEWVKTNPVPLNQSVNYLSNAREVAILGVKKGKPTFNSKYDNGIYYYPIENGKKRFHPTQKNIKMFEELIMKHSNEGDVVLDTFLGGGTTALASKKLKRRFIGCEIEKEYYDKIMKIID